MSETEPLAKQAGESTLGLACSAHTTLSRLFIVERRGTMLLLAMTSASATVSSGVERKFTT